MKKFILFFSICSFSSNALHAAIFSTSCDWLMAYTSCNAGYYLSGGDCLPCPKGTYKESSGTGGCASCATILSPTGLPTGATTTARTGTASHTGCYIPAGSSSDARGNYNYPQCPST